MKEIIIRDIILNELHKCYYYKKNNDKSDDISKQLCLISIFIPNNSSNDRIPHAITL